MDPALRELLEGDPYDELEAIIKLRRPDEVPPDVRIVAKFGDIATCRLARGRIKDVWGSESVISLKAPRLLEIEQEIIETASQDTGLRESDNRRPSAVDVTGKGVVIGIVDWGFDFAHPNFRNKDGSTRLIALWDQSSTLSSENAKPYGYGVVYFKEDIDRALKAPDPYKALGYHPAKGDPLKNGAHGTHVADIAAGNGSVPGSLPGIAPESDIVFVHLAAEGLGGLATLGDSVRILEALDFISNVAGDRPWVVNISMGRHGGPHEGMTLVEQAMDALLLDKPGRAIAMSTGNYFESRTHASGQLRPGRKHALTWLTDRADVTPNELEIWYPGRDRMAVSVRVPGVDTVFRASLGEDVTMRIRGKEVGRIYHRKHDPNNGDNHVDIFLRLGAPAGAWHITLIGEDIVDGRYHAWVERDAGCLHCQSSFEQEEADSSTTTGTICNGFRTIAVGAYNPHSPSREIASFSSSGPTRDGRQKPDLIAPGVSILAARSAPYDSNPATPQLTRKSGTSMAAPHVTGTIALMFEAAKNPLPIHDTRLLLLGSSEAVSVSEESVYRIGSGYLDVQKAVEAAREHVETRQVDVKTSMEKREDIAFSATDAIENKTGGEGIESLEPCESDDGLLEKGGTEDTESYNFYASEAEEDDERVPMPDEVCQEDEVRAETYVDTESFGARLVQCAEEIISSSEASQVSSDIIRHLLSKMGFEENLNTLGAGDFPSLAEIFDAFVSDKNPANKRQFQRFFEVIAEPGSRLNEPLQAGDLLVFRALGEGNLAHLSILVSGEAISFRNLAEEGFLSTDEGEGLYVHVIEGGAFPHTINDRFTRRLSSEAGQLDSDRMVLRLKSSETVSPSFVNPNSDDKESVGLPMEVAEGPQAQLTWIDLHLIRGPDGNRHLYYLLTGPGGGRAAQFRLRVRNTNSVFNFLDPYFLVRLRTKRADGSIDIVPLKGARGDNWKRIPWAELEDESSRTITFEIIPGTLRKAFDPDNALTWLDVRFRWHELHFHKKFYGRNTSLAFFLVAPATLMFKRGRVVHYDVSLRDPRYHRKFWVFVTEKTFSPSDRTPLEVRMAVEASVSSATTRGITVTGTYSIMRETGQTIDVNRSFESQIEAGIDDIIKVGAGYATNVGVSFTWTESRTRTYSQAARLSTTFTRSLTGRKIITDKVPPPPPGYTRQTLYLYPVVNIHVLPVYEYSRPNSLGQATRFRIVHNVPIAVPIGWEIRTVPRR